MLLNKFIKSGFPKVKFKRSKKPKKNPLGKPDYLLMSLAILISVIGVIFVYNSSVALAIRDFSDQYYFVSEQLRFLALGIILLFVFSFIDYRFWKKISIPILVVTILLLISVFLPVIGVSAMGASRWIKIGSLIVQPSEIAKLSIIIYLSAWLSKKERYNFLSFLIVISVMSGLIVLEPDLGTAVLFMIISIVLYFISNAPISHFLMITPLIAVSLIVLSVVSPYRMQRVMTFVNPTVDPLGSSYQIQQALLSIGSGGLFGIGLGRSRQKYEYLPEANTDSIFAIIAEELGFVGSFFLILLFALLLYRGIKIAQHVPDDFGKLLASGITFWIAIQTIINLSAMTAIMPLTGIPLPLVSYGGSGLIIIFSALGILINISKHRRL